MDTSNYLSLVMMKTLSKIDRKIAYEIDKKTMRALESRGLIESKDNHIICTHKGSSFLRKLREL